MHGLCSDESIFESITLGFALRGYIAEAPINMIISNIEVEDERVQSPFLYDNRFVRDAPDLLLVRVSFLSTQPGT